MNGRVFDAYSSESSATNYHTFFCTQQKRAEFTLMLGLTSASLNKFHSPFHSPILDGIGGSDFAKATRNNGGATKVVTTTMATIAACNEAESTPVVAP